MIIVGLTGSIGMGKTTAGRMLRSMGLFVHESDQAVHNFLDPNGEAFENIALTFPECWDKKNRIIKKDILSDLIFNDFEKKRELENILHPLVRKSQKNFILSKKRLGQKICILDIPLLFETGSEKNLDQIICVSAPYYIQRRRVMQRSNITEEKFLAILKTQMPDSEKQKRADYVVQTGLSLAHTYHQLRDSVRKLKGNYA